MAKKAVSPLAKAKAIQTAKRSAGNAPHLVIQARAGTGKTTTLVEGLNYIRGADPKITPSTQQADVWESLKESKGAAKIGFVAFNKKIAEELQRRVPAGVEASTMHSMGLRSIKGAFSGYIKVSDYRSQDFACEAMGIEPMNLRKPEYAREREAVYAVVELVTKCKLGLVNPTPENLAALIDHYDIDIPNNREIVYDTTAKVLERSKYPEKDRRIDFADMVWIPVVRDLFVGGFDVLLVDEAQDLGRCQQALAKKAGKRLVFCGDDRQAIYGFAGADSESLPRLMSELGDTDAGVNVLPLTVTRRCSKAVVAAAQAYVPEFTAHESNRDGAIHQNHQDTYLDKVKDQEMILCRVNAPLVHECFELLGRDRKANIVGRDIGVGLTNLVRKLDGGSNLDLDMLSMALHQWEQAEVEKESNKREPREAKVKSISDKAGCIAHLLARERARDGNVGTLIGSIETVFADNTTSGVRLSSIHKAKGLEAENTFILRTPRFDCKSKWQEVQEDNLDYVALTRAMDTATYVEMAKEGK